MREDVEQLLKELYGRTVAWQNKRDIRVELTEAEFIALWSKYRLSKLAKRILAGGDSLERYLRHPQEKPVCGWRKKADRASGVLTKDNAVIMSGSEQRKLFQFDAGDRHTPETRKKMRKPKTQEARDNMSKGATARWAKWRAERAVK